MRLPWWVKMQEQRGGYSILDQIETTEWAQAPGQAWAATLSDEPPKAVGQEMNGWVAAFSKQWIKMAEQKREREEKMLFTNAKEAGVQ